MIRATDAWLKIANDQTKVQTGHGPLGNKKSIADYNAMVKEARTLVEKLVNEGKSEAEVVAADPLKELNKTWAPDAAAGRQLHQAGLQLVQAVVSKREPDRKAPAAYGHSRRSRRLVCALRDQNGHMLFG